MARIDDEEMLREDLTQTAQTMYDSLKEAGCDHERAINALVQICKDLGVNGPLSLPTLKRSRQRAAKRIARQLLARGKPDREILRHTGLHPRRLREVKRELDAEMCA